MMLTNAAVNVVSWRVISRNRRSPILTLGFLLITLDTHRGLHRSSLPVPPTEHALEPLSEGLLLAGLLRVVVLLLAVPRLRRLQWDQYVCRPETLRKPGKMSIFTAQKI